MNLAESTTLSLGAKYKTDSKNLISKGIESERFLLVKKYKGLWQQVITEENIADAYKKSIKGKRGYSSVKSLKLTKKLI